MEGYKEIYLGNDGKSNHVAIIKIPLEENFDTDIIYSDVIENNKNNEKDDINI